MEAVLAFATGGSMRHKALCIVQKENRGQSERNKDEKINKNNKSLIRLVLS